MSAISKKEKRELILDLIHGFVLCKTIDEVIIFLEDLITKKELETLSKRLRIAKLLIKGYDYREIQEIVHASHSTIAKISYWLSERGEGFRQIVRTLPKESANLIDPLEYDAWADLRKRYPGYFLPELIMEGIVKNRSGKKQKRISSSLKNLEISLNRKKAIGKEVDKQS